jgi:predicted nucleic acid-binding protein
MPGTVYVETTVFSFYHDQREASAYRRKITRDWWRTQRRYYDVFTSYFALREVSEPGYPGWRKVAALVRRQAMLAVPQEIAGIVSVYVDNHVMPAGDAGDAAHLAVASYHAVDYLLTWNCRHLANANKFEHIRKVNRRLGLLTPELVTPEQLFRELT